MYGRKQKLPGWKDCTSRTLQRMKYAAGAIYVRTAFDQSALEKSLEMLSQIAYPEFILDSKELDNHYDNVLILIQEAVTFSVKDTDSYSRMVEKILRFDVEFDFKRLIKPVDRNEYNFNAAEVNAYYSPKFNAIGRQFDAIGNLRDWWGKYVKKKFLERAQCIIEQYGRIKVPGTGLKLNGKLTQGENIADNGGLKLALKAYKKYLKKHGEEKSIESFEQYNNEQIFFIAYALIWCGHTTPDELIFRVLADTHSPYRYRVNQVLANRPEFAEVFKCAVGTPMNPTERCAVW
ncbi:peptidase family M13 [Teladorsagia circumcincta]|uniref:Peptidase family M13 n=1 Tax=Teladorsagia circumcincta TaxID=45464 RepID=A0A2G9UQK4_TELCI|nr:peptidase family M13 [Teladorsagia circumcincta]